MFPRLALTQSGADAQSRQRSRFALAVASAVVVAAIVAAATGAVRAAIVAEFTDGNGNALPDQYVGTSGDGWLTPWETGAGVFGSGGVWTNTVASANPLAGSGNYLDARVAMSGFVAAGGALKRQYAEGGSTGITFTEPHTISWRFRVDALSGFSGNWDGVFETIKFSDESTGFEPNTWWIALANDPEPQWTFLSSAGGNLYHFFPTDVRFVVGDVYAVEVALSNAATGTWDGTVTNLDWDAGDGGLATATIPDLASASAQARGEWVMEVSLQNLDTFFVNGTLDFSLGSLRIVGPGDVSAIPEAHTVLNWGGLTMAALVAQWWQVRRSRML